jgi:hypothetical protein
MKVTGPLVDSYWAAVLLVVCALVPFLGLSSALEAMLPVLGPGVHLSAQALSLTLGMANAAYALGTVLAVQLAVHYPQRRLLVVYAGMFTIGSLLCATAFTPGLFIAGHVIQGLFTSMMLIGARLAEQAAADHGGSDESGDLRSGRRRSAVRGPGGQRRLMAPDLLDRLRDRRGRLPDDAADVHRHAAAGPGRAAGLVGDRAGGAGLRVRVLRRLRAPDAFDDVAGRAGAAAQRRGTAGAADPEPGHRA